jgi:hypothetical protein
MPYSKKAAFLFSIFSVTLISTANNITVVNSSNQSIDMSLQIPAMTAARIHLQPLEELKKWSQQELQDELFKAIFRDNPNDIRALAAAGANINFIYKNYNISATQATPLHIAQKYRKHQAHKALIELGATVKIGQYETYCSEPSRTQQPPIRKEPSINQIMKTFKKKQNADFLSRYNEIINGQSGNFSNITNYQSAVEFIHFAERVFKNLPVIVREKFKHNVAVFLDFIQNPANANELVAMGLR